MKFEVKSQFSDETFTLDLASARFEPMGKDEEITYWLVEGKDGIIHGFVIWTDLRGEYADKGEEWIYKDMESYEQDCEIGNACVEFRKLH